MPMGFSRFISTKAQLNNNNEKKIKARFPNLKLMHSKRKYIL